MQKYIIIGASSVDSMERQVLKKMSEGYRVTGGIAIGVMGECGSQTWFYQAMCWCGDDARFDV